MRLNNQGFAITGILYTLFILFLLILLSILGAISSKRNMLQQSISSEEDSFTGTNLNLTQAELIQIMKDNKAPVTGKYVFTITDIETKCFTYLNAGEPLVNETRTYSPGDCNDYNKLEMELQTVYSFDENGEEWLKWTIKSLQKQCGYPLFL